MEFNKIQDVLNKRGHLLDNIQEEPKERTKLVACTDESRSTVYRGINQLENHRLVTEESGRVKITQVGKAIYSQYNEFCETTAALHRIGEIIEDEASLNPILNADVIKSASITTGRECLAPEMYTDLESAIQGSELFLGYVPFISTRILNVLLDSCRKEADIIFGSPALRLLKTEFADSFECLFEKKSAKLHKTQDDMRMGLYITKKPTECLSITIHKNSGVLDGLIKTSHEKAIDWGENKCRQLRTEALQEDTYIE